MDKSSGVSISDKSRFLIRSIGEKILLFLGGCDELLVLALFLLLEELLDVFDDEALAEFLLIGCCCCACC